MKEYAPKVTLIKQPKPMKVQPVPNFRTPSGVKKKVFIKKKVVVVKPAKVVPEPPKEEKPNVQAQVQVQTPSKVQVQAQPKVQVQTPPKVKTPPVQEKKTVTIVSRSARISSAYNDPLRNGPVIIRDENLPPINPKKNPSQSGSGIPRQMGVVGGRNFGRPRTGFQRNGAEGAYRPNGNYPRRNFGGYRPPYGAKPPGTRYYGPGQENKNGFVPRSGSWGGYKGTGLSRRPIPESEPIGKTKRDYTSRRKENSRLWTDRKNEREGAAFRYKPKELRSSAVAVPKQIDILPNITVNELAKKMNLKASEIISKCFRQGMMLTINQQIDSDTASLIASDYGCEVKIVDLYDETVIPQDKTSEADLQPRAPIITVMGHVDHGKTKLLDAIRSTHVTESEYGGITQHIGAYKVNLPGKGDVVFLDTPGHAAFTMMRARGAQITDIVVLVVAANDGVMPQTIEAIDHARAAKVPIIVAINKCDLPDANPERVMQQLTKYDLTPEEWGGRTLVCKISALKKQGIEELLETILLEAEMLDLKAVRQCRAEGKILESRIDPGKGSVATIMVKRGTLREGDYYVAGVYYGHVRAMFDDRGNRIKEAGPSTPVEISGLSGLPKAGDPFQVTEDEKQAKLVGSKRQELERLGQAKKFDKVSLDNLYEKIKRGEMKELNVIIKGDVQGSVEALQKALEELSNDEIKLSVIRASAGAIVENDINLAIASENHAIVIGFNVRPTPKALQLAEQEKIDIRKYNIIYDAVDDIKAAMEGLLAPERTETEVGSAQVKQVFHVSKVGTIAGAVITSGSVQRNGFCRVIRDSIQLNKKLLRITSLKRFKDDVKEVAAGYECGIGIEGFDNLKPGDILEFVEIKETKRTLDEAKGAKPVSSEEKVAQQNTK